MNWIVGRNGKLTVGNLIVPTDSVFSKHYFRGDKFEWRRDSIKQRRGYTPVVSQVTINWAMTLDLATGIVYNTPRSVYKASNKSLARKIMGSAGVSIPKTYSIKYGGDTELMGRVIRRPLKHRAGKNVKVFDTVPSFQDGYYYSEFIQKDKEFRVHVGSGKLILCQEKVPTIAGNTQSIVWNHAGGEFVFENVRLNKLRTEVVKQGIDAVNSLGLDYGAVDVIVKEDNVYVVEVNTSPSLSDYSTKKYRQYFDMIRSHHAHNSDKFEISTINYTGEFVKSRDLVWRYDESDS